MKKYLVLYYSKTGNSKFFAEKTAQALDADIKAISPAIKSLAVLAFITSFKKGISTNIKAQDLTNYDEIILWGPIWMGTLIPPLRSVLKNCVKASKKIHFALTCETPEESKEDKYGYVGVLNEAKLIGGDLVQTAEAFSLAILKENAEQWTPKLSEKPKISEETFQKFFKQKFDNYMESILKRKQEILTS